MRPGVTGARLRDKLTAVANNAHTVEGQTPGRSALEILQEYLKWTELTSLELAECLPTAGVDALIHTDNYWALRSAAQSTPRLIDWVLQEIRRQYLNLEQIAGDLNAEIARWSGDADLLAVPDTNVFHDHGGKILGLDWPAMTGSQLGVRLVVPLAVMRELDRQKRSGRTELRASASLASRDLNQNLPKGPEGRNTIRDEPGRTLSLEAYVHGEFVDRTDVDGEIIAACAWIGVVSGRADWTRLVTGDGNMDLRARADGVQTILVPNMPPLPGE